MKVDIEEFVLPAGVLNNHIAVLGKTGSGKTSTSKLIVEHVVAQGHRVCVLDTVKSDWWGLTSSRDGKHPGLDFKILGGPRGHVPLHSNAGKVIGQLVGAGKLRHSVIDMADFDAGGIQKFFVDFAPSLMRNMKGVLYLVIEEAHEVAPKERAGFGAENMAIHFAKKLATAGRSKGIRLIVATQSVQQLHNRVLGSAETLIAHRLTAPADQEPVVKWLKANTAKETAARISAEMSSVPTGTAWVCSGEVQFFDKVKFPKFATYDNTSTPTGDLAEKDIKTAPVDQDELKAIIGDAVEEAKANDPAELKLRIRDLEKQVHAATQKSTSVPTPTTITQEVFVVRDSDLKAIDLAMETANACHVTLQEIEKRLTNNWPDLRIICDRLWEIKSAKIAPTFHRGPQFREPHQKVAHLRTAVQERIQRGRETNLSQASGDGIVPAQQRILNGLAFLSGIGVKQADKTQLALIVGVSPTSGGYFNNLGSLRTAGLISYPSGGTVALTDAGSAIASTDGVPSNTDELHDAIRAKLPPAKWKLLEILICHYPSALLKSQLADEAGVSPTSGGYFNNLGSLRSLGLIDYPSGGQVVANPVLFLN